MSRDQTVAFVYHDACLRHENAPGHPERPDRVRAVRDHLRAAGFFAADAPSPLLDLRPGPCARERLLRVHPGSYLAAIEAACRMAPARLDPDTGVSAGSWDAALRSAGGAVEACDAVVSGRARAAFVCTRPPGHHAEAAAAMGFCLFNNIAVAARFLQAERDMRRIFIVDWDVHHGNGTQHIFEDDGEVFYFSVHQYPFYPGTGAREERGRGKGAGATLNVPLPPGAGDDVYLEIFRDHLRPVIDGFRPEMILVSAGFDAHRADPLAGMALSENGYAGMTRVLRDAAAAHCDGRIVSLLEGGYDLTALARSVEAHLRELGARPAPTAAARRPD